MSVPGPAVDLRREDRETRLAAQLELDRPLVVEAGAGTGKTSILVARVVAWCLGPGWERAHTRRAGRMARRPAPAPGASGDASDGADAGAAIECASDVLDRVVAITFTEAAAAEMADRVGSALAMVEQGAAPLGVAPEALPDPEVACVRARALLASMHRLQARTIHSYCQGLLRSWPLEAGLDPGFVVDADGLELEGVVHETVEEELRRGGEARLTPVASWLTLAATGLGPAEVAGALQKLVDSGVRPEVLEVDPFDEATRLRIVAETAQAVRGLLDVGLDPLDSAKRARKDRETAAGLRALAETLGNASGSLEDVVVIAADAVAELGERLGKWAQGSFTKEASQLLGERTDEVQPASARAIEVLRATAALRPAELADARAVVAPLLAAVYSELRRRGSLGFTGLLVEARDLLQSRPEVCAQVRRDIDQLLVDEFQDTDQQQCELVAALALDGDPADRPGLFIVGDPKQSIYGWRNAELGAYESFVERVRAAGGRVGRLSVSFRSPPVILDEVQAVIEPVMRSERGLQPPFVPLLASESLQQATGFVLGDRGPVEHWVSWPREKADDGAGPGTATEATELEARALASDLVGLHREHDVRWSDIGVLLRSTTDLDRYLRELREAGVPYSVAQERGYYRRREVVEAAALVRTIVDPADQLALLSVLRSELVGVPDAALVPLWRAGVPGLMMRLGVEDDQDSTGDPADGKILEQLREAITTAWRQVGQIATARPEAVPGVARLAGWSDSLQWAAEQLEISRVSLRDDPPDRFVERVRTLWLAEPIAAARYLGGFRRHRLERFFTELESQLIEERSLGELVRFLRRAVERQIDSREPSLPEDAGEAVQVMTIHHAKGLDFRHVYLMQLHKRSRSAPTPGPAEVLVHGGAPAYALFGWPTPTLGEARQSAAALEQAERVRLLYVAMTRARERLVMCGRWPEHPQPIDPANARSLLDLVVHRAPAGLIEELAGAGEDGDQAEAGSPGSAAEAVLDERGIRWAVVSPETDRVSAADTAETDRGGPAAGDGAQKVRSDLEQLGARRREAAARQARPLVAAASAESHQELEREQREERLGADGTWPGFPVRGAGAGAPGPRVTPQEQREAAQAVGTEVHRLMETLDLGRPLRAQVDQRRQALAESAVDSSGERLGEAARERLDEILTTLAGGRCLERLEQIAAQVVARELPLLAVPADAGSAGGALAAIAGAADLVYEEGTPGTAGHGLVVVDFKTDRVDEPEAVQARAQLYAAQGRVYAQALADALDLPRQPRIELWFLLADEIVEIVELSGP